MHCLHVSNALARRYNPNLIHARNNTSKSFEAIGRKWGGRWVRLWLREQSHEVAKSCARQFECIVAQRIRRTLQIFHLYTKIWDEVALKSFVNIWRRRLGQNTRKYLFGAAGVSAYNWDRERIPDNELHRYSKELTDIYQLRENTVTCAKCHLRLVIDVTQSGVKYCQCHGAKPALASVQNGLILSNGDQWQPFIERQDMIMWRKEEPESGGLYAYKVYGSFPDVSAEDFLHVQVDVEYRKEWDPTARHLEVIDTDPSTESCLDHRSEIVYWEMIWPRLFANRDYVFQRRWLIDKEEGLIVIVSRTSDHPKAPLRPDTHRVSTYWSYMVIKPYTEFDQPGIEFGLTYFDDPGVNIPSAVTTWVAMSVLSFLDKGVPDFLCRMRKATLDYQSRKSNDAKSAMVNIVENQPIVLETCSDSSVSDVGYVSEVKENTETPKEKGDEEPKSERSDKKERRAENTEDKAEDKRESVMGPTPDEERGFLHYFLPSRLFT
ncbi:stAR-related lipid transfer protein 7, mitochondrial isoform X1 [Neodiprion pinetum]|uniref:stAR-related lipid transfer protein 7, mitochondrial isoform X1 n=1 Tax=Neodiprion pinetum TaxID=441929 RepID=UPI001EDC9A80|nr:stAR-related lipid transfer protein 7, mitochondrial isoform X1 [Neodiprion pinetum]